MSISVATAGVTTSTRDCKIVHHLRSTRHQTRNRLPHRKHNTQKSHSQLKHQKRKPEKEIFLMHPVQRPSTANNASQFSTVAKNDAVPNPTPQVLGRLELYTASRMLNTAYQPQRYGVAGATHAPCSAPGRNYKPVLKNSCARPGVNHFFVAPRSNLAQTARQPNAKYAHDRAHQRRQREQQSTQLASFGDKPMNHY